MNVSQIILVAMLIATPAIARNPVADHLVPEDTIYSGLDVTENYHDMVVSVLQDAYSKEVRIRAIVEPSFSPEFAVGVMQVGEEFKIFSLQSTIHLWDYEIREMMKQGSMDRTDYSEDDEPIDLVAELDKDLPPKPSDVKVDRCEIAIDAPLASQLIAAWQGVLLQTRFVDDKTEEGITGLDGDTFHFSMTVGLQNVAGSAWSPSGAKTGALAELAILMRKYCAQKIPTLKGNIRQTTGNLLDLLQSP